MDEFDEYQEWLYLTWGYGMESGVMGMKLEEQQKQDQQKREPRRSPQTAGERARAERDLRMGAHPIQGEQENDAYKA